MTARDEDKNSLLQLFTLVIESQEVYQLNIILPIRDHNSRDVRPAWIARCQLLSIPPEPCCTALARRLHTHLFTFFTLAGKSTLV